MNDQPFIQVLESMLKYALGKKLYMWKKSPPKRAAAAREREEDVAGLLVPRVSEGKLKDIAWSLGVEESIYAGEDKNGGLAKDNAGMKT